MQQIWDYTLNQISHVSLWVIVRCQPFKIKNEAQFNTFFWKFVSEPSLFVICISKGSFYNLACEYSKLPPHYFPISTNHLAVHLTECWTAYEILTECCMNHWEFPKHEKMIPMLTRPICTHGQRHTQHSTAVNISSRALANVFSIELRDRRNSDVAIPIAALFSTIIRTPGAPNTLPNSYNVVKING